MKKAEAHQLLQITRRSDLGHGAGVDLGRHQRLTVVDLDPWQVIETKHAAGAELPDNTGYANAVIVEKLLTEAGRVLGLHSEIKLPQQHTATFPSHGRPIPTTAPARMALKHNRHLLHHLEIEAEQLLQPRTLHFQHHLATAAQAGAMDLSQGGGTQRLRVEIDHLSATLPKLLLEHRLNAIKPEGRNTVLQSSQFLDPARRKNVRTRGKQLPQLDEG